MRRLLRALERAGLVEVDEGKPALDEESGIGFEPATDPEPEPATAPKLAPAPEVDGDRREPPASVEARPFAEIYAEHNLPQSPFPAERLLRVLDGLNALEPSARKTAVVALDAADDAWTVDDSLLDAERKLRALDTYRTQVEQQTRSLLAETKAAAEAREQRQQDTVARIRQQIADLEGLLEREFARASQDQAELSAAARASKEACARELARIDEEAAQLRRIAEIFAPQPAPSSHT